MPDNINVNATANYNVTTREVSDGSEIQQVQIDIGTGTSKSAVTASNPFPITGDVTTDVDTTPLATHANQTTIITRLTSLLTELQLKADLSEVQPISASSLPLPTGAATQTTLASLLTALNQLLDFQIAYTTNYYNVTANDVSDIILAENLNRKQATFYNDADKSAYLKIGSGASTTSFTIKIDSGGYYEMPMPCSTAEITCVWDSNPTGAMRITEFY